MPTQGSIAFYDLLNEAAKIHHEKKHDYSGHRFESLDNFVEAALYAKCTINMVFDVMLGIKRSRMNNLICCLEREEEPCFESINDTRKDIFVYEGLRQAFVTTFGEEWLHVQMTEERFAEMLNA